MTYRALLLDDDPWALRLLESHLNHRFLELELELRQDPDDLSGSFDVYLLDNEFHHRARAIELARRIRAEHPEALVVAFSATLSASTLRALINAGCNGACDKSDPGEMEQVLEIVGSFLKAQEARPSGGLRGAISEIRSLLREWNRRLDIAEVAEGAK